MTDAPATTFDTLAQAALRGVDPGSLSQAEFMFEQCRVRIRSNSPALVDELAAYFRPFIAPPEATSSGGPDIEIHAIEGEPLDVDQAALEVHQPEPGKTRIKEEFLDLGTGRVVRKRLTGMVFLFNEQINIASGHCLANSNQIVNFINNRFIQWSVKREWALCHAAGVMSKAGRGVVIAGISGAGKSTLSLHLVGRGLDFVSNDRILIRRRPAASGHGDETVRMVGVAKLPRINPGTIMNNPALAPMLTEENRRRYASMPREELWGLEEKYDVPIEEIFGPDRFHLAADVVGVYILNWSREAQGSTAITPIDLADHPHLLEALMKRLGVFYYDRTEWHEPEERPDRDTYLAILRHTPAFAVSGRLDFDLAAAAIEEQIRQG